MDTRRVARLERAISQVARVLEEEDIGFWIAGDWAERALGIETQLTKAPVFMLVAADDATDVRRTVSELGHAVVDITPSSFTTERGVLVVRWYLLWSDDQGRPISYDERDKVHIWPEGALLREKTGSLDGTKVNLVDPAADSFFRSADSERPQNRRRKDDLSRVKAVMHDRIM